LGGSPLPSVTGCVIHIRGFGFGIVKKLQKIFRNFFNGLKLIIIFFLMRISLWNDTDLS
jgi:hypothetical protein